MAALQAVPFRQWGSNSHVELHDNYYIYIYIYIHIYIYTHISCLACLSSRSSRRFLCHGSKPRGCRIWMGYTLHPPRGHGGPWWAMVGHGGPWPQRLHGQDRFALQPRSIWSWDHLNISGIHASFQVLYHLPSGNLT